MEYILVLLGFIMLFVGGEALISGASALAYRLRLPPVIVGVVLVGFGTSVPELLVSLRAAFDGVPDVAMGNVVGSNIANVFLILGVCSLITPIHIENIKVIKRDVIVMLIASILLCCTIYYGSVTHYIGIGLLCLMLFYMYLVYIAEIQVSGDNPIDTEVLSSIPITSNLVKVIVGIVLLAFGPKFLIQGGIIIAKDFGLSEAVIGLSIVAIGTSLPELSAGISSSMKKQFGLLLGNVIGSNIFNILLILGSTAAIKPFDIDSRFLNIDMPVIAISAASLAFFVFRQYIVKWWVGAIYLLSYIAYIYLMV